MNTNNVKNIVLILLVALNAALFGLIQWENNRFRLSAAQETAIRELFAANDIEITASIPRSFRPMRGLYVQPFYHDIDHYAALFFPNETPQREYAWNWVALRVGERELRLEGLYIGSYILRYENPIGRSTPAFLERGVEDLYASRALVDKFINSIIPNELQFVFNYAAWDEDSFSFDYRGYYRGYIIRDNSIRIRVAENGIVGATFRFTCIPYGFSNDSREIFSADEALLTVLQDLVSRHRGTAINDDIVSINVVNISFAYVLADGAPAADFITKAIPNYKISIEIDGDPRTLWVDAHTAALSRLSR